MDKKTIIAFVLIGLILIFSQTQFYKSKVIGERPIVVSDTTSVIDSLQKSQLDTIQVKKVKSDQSKLSIPESGATIKAISLPAILSKVKIGSEETRELTISSPLYKATLSSKGGGIVSWQLRHYINADSEFVELVPGMNYGLPAVGMVIDRDTVVFSDMNYNQSFETQNLSGDIILNESKPIFSIQYSLQFQDGKTIEKQFTFYSGTYDFDLMICLVGFSDLAMDRSYQIRWEASLLPTERPITDDLGYAKIYAYLGKDVQDFNTSERETEWKTKEVSGSVNWIALRTKYFVSAVAPLDEKGRSIVYQGKGISTAEHQLFKFYNFAINMPMSERSIQVNHYKVYLGPLEYNKLKQQNIKLDKLIMSSGGYERLFRPFSIIILVVLKFLHEYIPNYGLVIVFFSILIKIILYPLTHKSYVSMKKMQLIQPLMSELREKHKNNPQRLNPEMIKLYKEYGVNPMGGCLPLLLQMPLLIGLFIVFRSTIELRGAEFFWWIHDLSKPDAIFTLPFSLPLYGSYVTILPILMGITMFLQQKGTMQDPRQKMMAYFMPIFFVLLFNSFPSGLNLYYTLFNLFTIIQQHFIKTGSIELVAKEAKPSKKNRGK